MSGDEGSLPKSELGVEVRKCASCGAKADAADVFCAGCGAELPPMASSPSATAAAEPLSDQVVAVLATLAPRDALRGLFAGFPDIMKDSGQFPSVAEKLFAQDAKRCARYMAVQKSGVMLRLVGQSCVSASDWERVISDLAEFCGFSHEVCVECASEWAYALNVTHPEDPVAPTPASAVATSPSPVVVSPSPASTSPRPASTPSSPVVSPVGQVRRSAGSARASAVRIRCASENRIGPVSAGA